MSYWALDSKNIQRRAVLLPMALGDVSRIRWADILPFKTFTLELMLALSLPASMFLLVAGVWWGWIGISFGLQERSMENLPYAMAGVVCGLPLPYIAWMMFSDCMRFINYPWRGRRLA